MLRNGRPERTAASDSRPLFTPGSMAGRDARRHLTRKSCSRRQYVSCSRKAAAKTSRASARLFAFTGQASRLVEQDVTSPRPVFSQLPRETPAENLEPASTLRGRAAVPRSFSRNRPASLPGTRTPQRRAEFFFVQLRGKRFLEPVFGIFQRDQPAVSCFDSLALIQLPGVDNRDVSQVVPCQNLPGTWDHALHSPARRMLRPYPFFAKPA